MKKVSGAHKTVIPGVCNVINSIPWQARVIVIVCYFHPFLLCGAKAGAYQHKQGIEWYQDIKRVCV